MSSDARTQCLYFSAESLRFIKNEAKRLQRPMSWVVQQAIRIAASKIRQMPSAPKRGAL